ncbi:unnamed protein product [Linum trigynum]|uniref:Uncharacterized protein n=1 Tax=Linum trigynum TaxID=586398 RepID=A0AAV2G3Y6_9ROSI
MDDLEIENLADILVVPMPELDNLEGVALLNAEKFAVEAECEEADTYLMHPGPPNVEFRAVTSYHVYLMRRVDQLETEIRLMDISLGGGAQSIPSVNGPLNASFNSNSV